MTTQINGTSGITFSDSSVQNTAGINFRNRIINGAMMIDQRNAGASITASSAFPYSVDRWSVGGSSSRFTAQQVTTAPSGFSNSLLITSSGAYSPGANEEYDVRQPIEANNMQDLAWGTASAATVTMSFWVRSSLTGTFGGALYNYAGTYSYPFTYTINSANTWEQKTITIAGPTAGSWNTGNTGFVWVVFSMGVGAGRNGTAGAWASAYYAGATGQTNVVGTNGATWYVTGVQLEKGTTASSFDYRSYGQELALCQRYYYRNSPGASNSPLGAGTVVSGTAGTGITQFPVAMRTAPSALEQTGTASDYNTSHAGSSYVNNAVPTFVSANTYIANTQFANGGTMISGGAVILRTNSTTGYLGWSAEL